ncbi:DPP IV N-terminal domain-containing protein [Terriglobus aquaticus]|uniref:DPP IV N-terminal domain-containing protein n=1 Tax=Terriglobus aquaticus TaxID=940139 RepID=UPI0021E015D4|nr:DPP IV N-terminal domain-containing protein [Terriglobus aquaticus]
MAQRSTFLFSLACSFVLSSCSVVRAAAQDTLSTGINKGVDRIRIAPAPFHADNADAGPLKVTFDAVLESDLKNAGVFDVVSKSMEPQAQPANPKDINLSQWSQNPANAAFVALGGFGLTGGRLVVNAFVVDTHNAQYPQVIGKQYTDTATDENARQIAHRFADEIILRLGGGLPGIAETKLYFIHAGGGTKEVWAMDYDGANPHAITHLGSIALSPRVSPDNSRVAFSTISNAGNQIRMYSLLLGRMVNFSQTGDLNITPAWSSTGQLAWASSRSGNPEIYVGDASGNGARRVTNSRGSNSSPTWNPKTGSQIAFISSRTGLPQLYIMDADGANVQRMTDGGYATSVSWSPNGQFLAFAWNRKYGPGAPGGQDIYVMDIASKRWVQLTNGIGRCDFPTWSPDGRHIAFAVGSGPRGQIWSMLADGTEKQKLTSGDMPNWSFR